MSQVGQLDITGNLADVNTLTGDSGGAVGPTGGNINVLGGTNITTVGNPATSTLTVDLDAALTGISSITTSTGGSLRTGTSAGNTTLLQAYDTNTGPAYVTFATLTAGTDPSFAISGATIDNSIIGATTPANAQYYSPVNVQTGTTYTVAASDAGKVITLSNASAVTVTLPQQSTTTTSVGFWVRLVNLGAGAVTVVTQGAETLTGNTQLDQGAQMYIYRNTTTNWATSGGTAVITGAATIFVQTVANVAYAVVKMPFACTITQIDSICRSGTCTATSAINATPVTATANSVSNVNNTQAVTGANTVAAGDYINVGITANAACLDMTLTYTYTVRLNVY